MPTNSQSYHGPDSVQTNRSGKTGGLKGKPDVGRDLGKSYPAGKETRESKNQSGSISARTRKLG